MRTQTLDTIPVHDRYILAHEPSQTYYMYTAADQDRGMADGYGVSAYTSTDLCNWAGPHRVFDVPEDSWAEPKRAQWAPEVHEYNGRF